MAGCKCDLDRSEELVTVWKRPFAIIPPRMDTTRQPFTNKDQPYHSYLLRLWCVKTREGWGWQASLDNIATGKTQGFLDLESLSPI